jgi:hypothetical protein
MGVECQLRLLIWLSPLFTVLLGRPQVQNVYLLWLRVLRIARSQIRRNLSKLYERGFQIWPTVVRNDLEIIGGLSPGLLLPGARNAPRTERIRAPILDDDAIACRRSGNHCVGDG